MDRDKDLEKARSEYFKDLDYSNRAPSYGDNYSTPQSDNSVSTKRSWSFLPALIGAVVGGIIVAVIIFAVLYFTGNLNNRSYDAGAGATINYETEQAESAIEAVAQVVPKSVVGIYATGTQEGNSLLSPQGQTYASVGSGFFVTKDGYIVTNQHVTVNNDSQITVSLYDGSEHEGKVVWSDSNLDVAIVKIDVQNAQPLSLGNSEDLKVGQTVIAVGNPLGLEYSRSVTAGIISAIDRSLVVNGQLVAEGLIQTDAAINSGNSGGPLVNTKGEVIGINTYKQVQGEGMGFAIPINLFVPIIQEVVETGTFKPVLIGITGYDPEQAEYLNQNGQIEKFDHGIYVAEVENGSPAQAAGLQTGDIIKTVDGKEVNTMIHLRTLLYSHKNGDKVTITYTRGGKEQQAEVTLKK